MLHQLRVLLRKEFLQLSRDRVIMRMLFIMPMIQLLILANAASFEVKRSRLWVTDQDRSSSARTLLDGFVASGRFEAMGAGSVAGAHEAMLRGDIDAILVIPAEFERDLQRTRRATVQLVLDAVDGSQAGVSQGYAASIVQDVAGQLAARLAPDARPVRVGLEPAPRPMTSRVTISARNWFNPGLNYQWFTVPGILTQLVTLIGTLMTALNIVREKEAGTLDQLNVTPMTRSAFIIAKLLPFWCIALVQLGVGLLIARFVFGVPMTGNVGIVFLGAAIYLVAALGLGLLISTIADTQQQAMFVTFAVVMVYTLMSGLYTPVRGMPGAVQWIAQINPTLHFISIVRAVTLKGATLTDLLPQFAALAVLGTVISSLAVLQYRKRAL